MNTTVVTEVQPTYQAELTPDGWMLNLYGKRAGTITSPEGKRITTYFGFNTEAKAREFEVWINGKNKDNRRYCSDCKIRTSQRLSTPFEAKVWDCPMWLVEDSLKAELKEQPS